MNRIILQPAGNGDGRKHYFDTIENQVPQNRLNSFLDVESREKVEQIYVNKSIPVWGVTPGKNNVNVGKWNKINVGDVTLFSRKGGIYSSGVVTHKIHNKELALELWGVDQKEQTWEYIYFLDEIKEQQIAYEVFNNTVGYSSNYVIQGFNVLDELKSSRVFEGFDLSSEVHFPYIDETQFKEVVIELDRNQPLDQERKGKFRTEQAFLRKQLLGDKKISNCSICGEEFPVGFLVAAHIKKRSHCSIDEKLDYKNIVLPMCKFGCDDLFEKGYIYVADGSINLNKSKLKTNFISNYLANIEGNRINSWSNSNKEYFEWHFRFHGK